MSKIMSKDEIEAQEVLHREQEQKHALERSKFLLRQSLEDDSDQEDVQDLRLERCRTASALARIYSDAATAQTNAKVNYKLAVKVFKSTSNQEAAEQSYRDALMQQEAVGEELEEVLPYCPEAMLLSFQQFHNVFALPKKFRAMIGKKILEQDTEKADELYQANGRREVEKDDEEDQDSEKHSEGITA